MRPSSAALAFVALLGCTLVAPESDYFDARGLETIATVDATVDGMVIASDQLYVAVGTNLLRKSVESTAPLERVATTRTTFSGLTTDGAELVAWCDGGAWVVSSNLPPTQVPGSVNCASIAVGKGTVVYLETSGSLRARRWNPTVGGPSSDIALPVGEPSPLSVGVSPNGTLYVGSTAGVMRECRPTDRGCESGFCRIASSEPSTRRLDVVGDDAAARTVWFDGVQGVMTAPTSACCPLNEKNCDADPLRQRRAVGDMSAVAFRAGHLFVLEDGAVRVVDAFADPTRDVAVAPADANARVLAVGERRVVFTMGSRIVRAGFLLEDRR